MNIRKKLLDCSLMVLALAGTALACGHPPVEPPPPPAPPVVCCRIVSWFQDPICGKDTLLICYFREDGLPLYVSNPMPLPGNQQCACGFPRLPEFPGVADEGIIFGPMGNPSDSCIVLPNEVPGYGPFTGLCDPQTNQQIDSFFDVFTSVGQIPPSQSLCMRSASVFQFRGGPDQFIPPGVNFTIYRKISIPRGFDPRLLAPPTGGLSSVGLFLVDNGVPFVEPPAAGLPPIPFSQFSQNPGFSAFYKVKVLPFDLPGPCPFPCIAPPSCPGDADNNGLVNFADITSVLANFGSICP